MMKLLVDEVWVSLSMILPINGLLTFLSFIDVHGGTLRDL